MKKFWWPCILFLLGLSALSTAITSCDCANNTKLVKCSNSDGVEVYSQTVTSLIRGETAWQVTEQDGTNRTLKYPNCTWKSIPKKK